MAGHIVRVGAQVVASPGSAQTAVGISAATQLMLNWDAYTEVYIDAILQGATGGTLDVTIQRRLAPNAGNGLWADWLHFPQLAAAAPQVHYTVVSSRDGDGVIRVVGGGTDAAPTPVVGGAGFVVAGHPGEITRLVFVAGTGTSAGANQTLIVSGWAL